MLAIIDYDAGNIKSVEKALHYLGEEIILTRDSREILSADRIILPGVGSFKDCMDNLNLYGLPSVIREAVFDQKIPFLGICLGQQMLFESSEESPGVPGLGLLEGEVKKIPKKEGLKIPHMGWNRLHLQHEGRLFQEIPQDSYVYFVHSYYVKAKDESIVKGTADYSVTIHATVEKDNIFGCQFHPEKSSDCGIQMLKNFTTITKEVAVC